MCGISGIYGLEGLEKPAQRLRQMNDAVAHRGPDADGIFEHRQCVLGHRRLSIIDLHEASNQPFHSFDGRYTIVFNGEIYNFRELRAQLADYPFKTQGDTEVLVAAFARWGIKCLQLLNGMFAFAIWDHAEEKLWIARDRLGIKPLYYSMAGASLVFASELRAVLRSGLVKARIDRSALHEYLRYQCVHAPKTMVEGVFLLEPGTYLEIHDNDIQTKKYWMPWQKLHFDQDPIVIRKRVRDLLTSAVERRLVADVPFGAFLSGGIDSSLIVGIMSERLGHACDTFNVSFDEGEFSESAYARLIAKRFHTQHHEIRLTPSHFLEALPEAVSAMDHPSGDGPNTWIVSRETKKQGITMALSGLGGDELFAGYDVFKRIPYVADRGWILSFPKGLRHLAGRMLETARPGMASSKTREILTSDYFDLENLYPIFRKVLLEGHVRQAMGKGYQPENAVRTFLKKLEAYDEFGQLPVLSRISVAEMQTYMQNVLLRDADQMSMAHALEVRVPFLDHELVEYVMHVPDAVKFPHRPKQLLVESFADLLPTEVVDRPKMGFVLPWEHWMRSELKSFCEERIAWLEERQVFQPGFASELWNGFLQRRAGLSWSRVWPLIVLSDWMKKHDVEA